MWDDYAARFRATDMYRGERGAYYSPMDDSVHLRIDSVARGDIIHAPYATLFHEYGHITDYLIARDSGRNGAVMQNAARLAAVN